MAKWILAALLCGCTPQEQNLGNSYLGKAPPELVNPDAKWLNTEPLKLEKLKGYVADSGEGRWTIQEAIAHDVPATVLAHSLFARFTSRQDDSYAMKVAAALRNQFGGHEVKK